MIACWVALAFAAFVLGALIMSLPVYRRHRSTFEPLPDLERPEAPDKRLVTRWPPSPVHVLDEPVLRDGAEEGWFV